MRRTMGVLVSCLVLAAAGCGGDDSPQGESIGDNEFAGEGTRDTGSVGGQVSAQDVAQLEQLRVATRDQCNQGSSDRLTEAVDGAVAVAAQNKAMGVVDLNNVDRSENIEDFLGGMADLLERCGAAPQAERLRQVEYGSALEGGA